MTLHYRDHPDLSGVHFGPPSASTENASWCPRGGANAAAQIAIALPALDRPYAATVKRMVDLVLAIVALVLYSQERLGRNGKHFRMWKLRTMVRDADTQLAQCLARDPALQTEWDLTQKLKSDPRITPIGRLLRKTSMDELPQILNVIKGDMSLVGPRPMLPEQMPLYRHPQAYLGLRPGLTGLWQVTARNEDSFDLRATLDLRYAQRLSAGLDLRIMVSTFGVVLHATGY